MIKKERKMPVKIRKLEALLRRLSLTHPKRKEIASELAKSMAGYKGEQSLDYYLSFLPDQDYFIFHDLRLPHKYHFFQIDILILSSSFFLVLEAKNISGSLLFDHAFHQLIRTTNGIEEVFPDPILQIERQVSQLVTWLEQNECPFVLVESLVVITNPSALIKSTPHDRMQAVIRSTNLPAKFAFFQNLYNQKKLATKELRKISSLLLKHHKPHNPDILQRFHVLKTDLLTGVQCPSCFYLPMERRWGKWNCSRCSCSSNDAHLFSLNDYALLLQSTITNQQLRDFLQLSSDSVAKKLLIAMDMPYTGATKARKYHLSIEE